MTSCVGKDWYHTAMEVSGRLPGLKRLLPVVLSVLLAASGSTSAAPGTVVELEIEGGIGVATADYIRDGIEYAVDAGAELIIINVDTPGGLVKPMRSIVQDILASPVPVATYVTPPGARADSAGTYILLASHIAAMAPTTHLGAATPVPLMGGGEGNEDGGEEESTGAMERKVMNDAIAYIRGLAEQRGRNADWAEKAVLPEAYRP